METTFWISQVSLNSSVLAGGAGFESFDHLEHGLSAFWADTPSSDQQAKITAALTLLATSRSAAFIGTLQQSVPALALPLRRVERRLLRTHWEVHDDGAVTQSSLVVLDPLVIGINNRSSPWYKLVYEEDSSLSTIKKVVTRDLGPPSSYVFPLNWPDAMEYLDKNSPAADARGRVSIGLSAAASDDEDEVSPKDKLFNAAEWLRGEGDDEFHEGAAGVWRAAYGFSIPVIGWLALWLFRRGLREAASDFGDALSRGAREDKLNDTMARLVGGVIDLTEPLVGWITFWAGVLQWFMMLVGALLGLSSLVLIPLFWVLKGICLVTTRRDCERIEDVIDALRELLSGEGFIYDALDALDEVVDSVEHYGAQGLLGLPDREAAELERALLTSSIEDGDIRPLLHISPGHFDYYFDGYSTEYLPTDESYWPDDIVRCWPRWVRQAGPTLQFAFTLNLASVILEQALNQESALLVASGLADNEGSLGSTMRDLLKAQGYECMTEALSGISFSRFLRYLWRQYMTDLFVQSWIDDGHDADCLYEVFCWMRTEDRRHNLDSVLGAQQTLIGNPYQPRDYGDPDAILAGLLSGQDLCEWWDDLSCTDQQAVRDFLGYQACSLSDRLDALECEEDEVEPSFWESGPYIVDTMVIPPGRGFEIDIAEATRWDDWFRDVTTAYDDMLGIVWDRYGPWTGAEPDMSFLAATALGEVLLASTWSANSVASSRGVLSAARTRSATWLSGGGIEVLRGA